jgi:hypothetical protein
VGLAVGALVGLDVGSLVGAEVGAAVLDSKKKPHVRAK